MKYPILVFTVLFVLGTMNGQDSIKKVGQDSDQDDSFFNRITLRKSFQSKNDKAEPAVVTYSNAENKEESWILNAAVGVSILNNIEEGLTLSPYLEYHRNTLVDKEQDNFQTGLATEWQLRDMSRKKWTPILIASLKYNEDNTKDISSFQGNYYFTPLFKGKAKNPEFFYIPNNISDFGKLFQFVYSPYLGLENENRFSTEMITDEGDIYRTYFRITANFSLFPGLKKLEKKFEFSIDWQYRYNIEENVEGLDKSDHNYFSASFNYILFTAQEGKRSAKVGVDYVNGDDPSRNFEEQSFFAVSLKINL
ncbi:hypothetical protein [Poritiphilus flavus]|uniref:Uncharacterized protein n=1 Tax=Poritiphilus flavus TaxID=2697053 RepID=A0A6L9EC07_9FLAO|nr:hypothetical protein [Poritiphilus flavus]NAS12284.1 hypothetical protein [Poritiphilus flavus]